MLFAMGGIYDKGTDRERFALVKPSGNNELPYVVRTSNMHDNSLMSLENLSKHHSHLYAIQEHDLSHASLIHEQWQASSAGVGAPESVVLPDDVQGQLKKVVETNSFYDLNPSPRHDYSFDFARYFGRDLKDFMNENGFNLVEFATFIECGSNSFRKTIISKYGEKAYELLQKMAHI